MTAYLRGAGPVRARRILCLLQDNETLRLPRGAGLVLRCRSGTLLVTRAGDPADHVLEVGGELRLPARGLAVAWALSDAELEVEREPEPAIAAAA